MHSNRHEWTKADDRAFHRHAWCFLAGWVEMIAPARPEPDVRFTSRAPEPEPRTASARRWPWYTAAGIVLVLLWILV